MRHVRAVSEAQTNAREAVLRIAHDIMAAQVPYWWVTYAGIARRPGLVLGWLAEELGLMAPGVDVYDADGKWWEECEREELRAGEGQGNRRSDAGP